MQQGFWNEDGQSKHVSEHSEEGREGGKRWGQLLLKDLRSARNLNLKVLILHALSPCNVADCPAKVILVWRGQGGT